MDGKILYANSDLQFTHYPNLVFGLSQIRLGELPLWNPYIFAGQDFSASMHNHGLNPSDWPLALVPEDWLLHAVTARAWIEMSLIGVLSARTAMALTGNGAISILFDLCCQLSSVVWFGTTIYIGLLPAPCIALSCFVPATHREGARCTGI